MRGWAERGIPLAITLRGIDRHFERYYSKGPRRRPVQIDFCEADVFELFDQWRRAVGVRETVESADGQSSDLERVGRRPGLRTHIDRLIATATALRSSAIDTSLDLALERVVRELDGLRESANRARGHERERILNRLLSFDEDLVSVLQESITPEAKARLVREAEQELGSFRTRMTDDTYRHAVNVSVQRMLRERAGLPRFALD